MWKSSISFFLSLAVIGGASAQADSLVPGLAAGASGNGSSDAKISDLLNSKWNKNAGETTLSFDGAAYEYSPRTETGAVYPALIGHWSDSSQNQVFKAVGNVETMLIVPPAPNTESKFDSPQFYFEVPEAYVGTNPNLGPVEVSVGRKLEQWNRLDDLWRLGIWQPRFNWDYLSPEIVGLTGAFLTFNEPHFKFVGFGTGIYIPERGVPTASEGGEIVSSSPFFTPPPKYIDVLGHPTLAQYSIDMPSMSSIVFQPGVSLMARVGDQRGPWASGAYAYKPVNQLLIAFNAQNAIDSNTLAIPLMPMVAYHSLGSFDLGYSDDAFDVWVSNLIDRPYATPGPAGWTYQQISSSYAVSPAAEVRFGALKRNPIRLQLSYLSQWGGNAPDFSPDGVTSSNGSLFDPRYPYQRAMLVGGELPLANFSETLVPAFGGWTRHVLILSRYIYDFSHEGAILSTDIKYRPSASWQFGVGVDLLGSNEALPADGGVPSDFIGKYAANDRVRWSLTYVF